MKEKSHGGRDGKRQKPRWTRYSDFYLEFFLANAVEGLAIKEAVEPFWVDSRQDKGTFGAKQAAPFNVARRGVELSDGIPQCVLHSVARICGRYRGSGADSDQAPWVPTHAPA